MLKYINYMLKSATAPDSALFVVRKNRENHRFSTAFRTVMFGAVALYQR